MIMLMRAADKEKNEGLDNKIKECWEQWRILKSELPEWPPKEIKS